MEGPIFLSLNHVLRLHARQIERYRGSEGIRDTNLIESAIAQPQQSFGGEYLHNSLPAMAAAYLFHLAKNHGFVDGNKRVAAAAALTFLEVNGIDTDRIDETEMEKITIAVADATADKQAVTAFFVDRLKAAE
jgi:death-on-curing protein